MKNQNIPTTAESSARLAVMFENGSGDVLIARRDEALTACMLSASVPEPSEKSVCATGPRSLPAMYPIPAAAAGRISV